MSPRTKTGETEMPSPDTEQGMVLLELRRLGRAVESLAEKLDDRMEKLEARVRQTEVELAKVTTKISVAVGFAGAAGAALVELIHALR